QALSLDLQRFADPLFRHLLQMVDDKIQLPLPEPVGHRQVKCCLDKSSEHRHISRPRIRIPLCHYAQKVHARQEQHNARSLQDLLVLLPYFFFPLLIIIISLALPLSVLSAQEIVDKKYGASSERHISDRTEDQAGRIRIISSVDDIHKDEKESAGH